MNAGPGCQHARLSLRIALHSYETQQLHLSSRIVDGKLLINAQFMENVLPRSKEDRCNKYDRHFVDEVGMEARREVT